MIRAVSYSDLGKSKNRSARLLISAGSMERNVVHTGLAASRLAASRLAASRLAAPSRRSSLGSSEARQQEREHVLQMMEQEDM